MIHLILTISLFSFTTYAKFQCNPTGKIRVKTDNGNIVKKSRFCFNHFEYKIISLDCIKDDSCMAIKKYKHMKGFKINSQIGSPYHSKCYILGGSPQLIEYFDGTNWHETGICNFIDNSFISVFNSL